MFAFSHHLFDICIQNDQFVKAPDMFFKYQIYSYLFTFS